MFLTVTQGDCKCGNVAVDDRMTGLAKGEILNRPWMVKFEILLQSEEMIVCSGSLLNRRWIISAAHCFCALYEVSLTVSQSPGLFSRNDHQYSSSLTVPRESGGLTRYSARNPSLVMGSSLRNWLIGSRFSSGRHPTLRTTVRTRNWRWRP